jgi:hypothetical protein
VILVLWPHPERGMISAAGLRRNAGLRVQSGKAGRGDQAIVLLASRKIGGRGRPEAEAERLVAAPIEPVLCLAAG